MFSLFVLSPIQVIQRLGYGKLDGKVYSLKDKILDYSTRNSIRLDLALLRDRVWDVEKSVAQHIPPNLKGSYIMQHVDS
jgi:hypothetical protein